LLLLELRLLVLLHLLLLRLLRLLLELLRLLLRGLLLLLRGSSSLSRLSLADDKGRIHRPVIWDLPPSLRWRLVLLPWMVRPDLVTADLRPEPRAA
jgi:hypothetical protein